VACYAVLFGRWAQTTFRNKLLPSGSDFVFSTNGDRLDETSEFLGAFSKVRKATTSFVMCARLSVCVEQLESHWTDLR
jgi:hypothetical protein